MVCCVSNHFSARNGAMRSLTSSLWCNFNDDKLGRRSLWRLYSFHTVLVQSHLEHVDGCRVDDVMWQTVPNVDDTDTTLPLLLVSWSASNGYYCPPDVQTPDLHCSTRQYTTSLVSLFIISRNHCETPDQQTTQHSSHYQHVSTHICFHFSLGLLPIGTNCLSHEQRQKTSV